MRTPLVYPLLGFATWGILSLSLARGAEEACASCHEQAKKIQTSAHANLGCASCHTKHEAYPHPTGVPKPVCSECHAKIVGEHSVSVHGQAIKKGNTAAPACSACHGDVHEIKDVHTMEFHKGVPETCGMCHSEIAEQFRTSVHGKAVAEGNMAAPLCTNCHGEHSIFSPKTEGSPVYKSHIRETCGQCHGNVRLARKFGMPGDRIVTFDKSFHGLAAKSGAQLVANCASCHGFHAILPSSDARATTNPKNLPKTCGHCHPGAGTRFTLGPVHLAEGSAEPEAVKWVRIAYGIIIPLTIGFMLLHNAGDWLRKLWERRLGRQAAAPRMIPGGRGDLRMYRAERVQHALLASSFLVLVWTGFALKYPDQWWASPLVHWERYFSVRGVVHRAAAVVMLLAGALHGISLLADRNLRRHWRQLWPTRGDVPEAIQGFAYNLGLVSRKPYISPHSYVEKAEYWAVVWGTLVMAATGVLLWTNNLSLKWLPKSVTDVATAVHLYEAILATLSILVWHFYTVIFDPDVYPVDTAWLTGYSVKQHGSHQGEESRGESPEIGR